ncbi:MAG: TIGR00730 family Rossman fold protein [Thermoanaerobaculia bacterium]
MTQLGSLCVFCGSNFGRDPVYRRAAKAFAELLAERRLTLVYGGGNVGLMGVIADTVMAGGGKVIGVIPQSLVNREVAHHGITDLQVVTGMHERKQRMYEQADATVALPGGAGTFDELFEAFTWNQLGIHFKPVGLFNVDGYFDPLIAMLDRTVDQGFLRREQRDLLVVADNGPDLLEALASVEPSGVPKWIHR